MCAVYGCAVREHKERVPDGGMGGEGQSCVGGSKVRGRGGQRLDGRFLVVQGQRINSTQLNPACFWYGGPLPMTVLPATR